eukprot:CAMPEP_0177737592 /NCGR_PEP_ID=MMETSP0484_2-20121128/25970_1 /TAXON_ID=354590 /ORGANISM="Rhodomonas lens, Strain RHODO" /LENGTH=69 /DNA_ID=CAMNT_0019251389 /DNA_START=55 /DNA_END=265 /DNA_ORIENTATION=-
MSSLSTTSSPHLTTFFARKRSVNDGGPVPALPASLASGCFLAGQPILEDVYAAQLELRSMPSVQMADAP